MAVGASRPTVCNREQARSWQQYWYGAGRVAAGRIHPPPGRRVVHRAERMLNCLSSLAHGLWICIKALLHSFEQMLMESAGIDMDGLLTLQSAGDVRCLLKKW